MTREKVIKKFLFDLQVSNYKYSDVKENPPMYDGFAGAYMTFYRDFFSSKPPKVVGKEYSFYFFDRDLLEKGIEAINRSYDNFFKNLSFDINGLVNKNLFEESRNRYDDVLTEEDRKKLGLMYSILYKFRIAFTQYIPNTVLKETTENFNKFRDVYKNCVPGICIMALDNGKYVLQLIAYGFTPETMFDKCTQNINILPKYLIEYFANENSTQLAIRK